MAAPQQPRPPLPTPPGGAPNPPPRGSGPPPSRPPRSSPAKPQPKALPKGLPPRSVPKPEDLRRTNKRLRRSQMMTEEMRQKRCTMFTTNPSALQMFSHKKMDGKGKSVGFGEDRPIKSVKPPEWVTMIKQTLFEKGKPNPNKLREQLFNEGRLSIDSVKEIIRLAQKFLAKEPNVLRLGANIDVVGDLHGQFYDLLNLFTILGDPCSNPHSKFLFLGDYIDRGMFSVEVCLYLFTLKINYPDRIFLLRGNHESREISAHFNFQIECQKKYSAEIYECFMDCFDYLPLAATVTTRVGTFLCLHGGLSPYITTVDEIDEVDRVMEPPAHGAMCDILWSDPMDETQTDDLEDEDDLYAWYAVDYADNPARGCGWMFGGVAIDKFLTDNDLLMLVRAHEAKIWGYFFHQFLREDREHPMAITVFSAPNYCDIYGNDAGVLRLTNDSYDVIQTKQVPHPFFLPGFCDAVNYTIPFVFEGLSSLCLNVLQVLQTEEETGDLSKKIGALGELKKMSNDARQQNEESILGEAKDIESFEKTSGDERWERAKKKDKVNDMLPREGMGKGTRFSSIY